MCKSSRTQCAKLKQNKTKLNFKQSSLLSALQKLDLLFKNHATIYCLEKIFLSS